MSSVPSTVSIRPITREDIASFTDALRAVAMERRFLATSAPPLHKQITDFVTLNIDTGYPQLVATSEGSVIGWCDAVAQRPAERKHVARMGMGVISEFRGQGIGRRLITRCIDLAIDFGFEKIELDVYHDNLKAIALYEANGFHVEGTREKSRKLDGRYQDIVLMARFLVTPV